MQNKFEELRDDFSIQLEKYSLAANRACWDFYTNSNSENMSKYETSQEQLSNLFKDEKYYNKLLEINIKELQKHEQKQLKNLLKSFEEEINTGEDLKELRNEENKIAKAFNSYIPNFDGNEYTKAQLFEMTQNEKDPILRKKIHKARIDAGNTIADELINLIKLRNKYAQKKGFKNYFEYKLQEDYYVDAQFLERLIKNVFEATKDKIREVQTKKQAELKKIFNISELKEFHYGLLLDNTPEKAVNSILKENNIENISMSMYKDMGYDVDNLIKDKQLVLDLYPRKNKNTHGFCFDIEAGKDVRILANLINNISSLETLNHEMGHSIYDLGIDTKLTYLDRTASSPAFTEAIAMMMGDIIKRENVLSKIVDDKLLEQFKNTYIEDEVNFISRSLLIIEFEQEIYKNPEENPAKLWQHLNKKYLNKKCSLNNEWATIPHYLSHPAYYQNYFRANLMKVQIYNFLKEKLGEISSNRNSAKFMDKNIFSYGASIEEYDLIKQLTGKDFSEKDFIEIFNR